MRLAAGHDFVEFSISTESPCALDCSRWAQYRREDICDASGPMGANSAALVPVCLSTAP